MACGSCMTHTNPEPCCGHDHGSSFGKPFGFDLVQVENPPWIPTVLGALVAAFGYKIRDEESDLAVPLLLGGLMLPGIMWLKYSYPPSSEYGGDNETRDNDERKKTLDNEKKAKKRSRVVWKSYARSRNFGSSFSG